MEGVVVNSGQSTNSGGGLACSGMYSELDKDKAM